MDAAAQVAKWSLVVLEIIVFGGGACIVLFARLLMARRVQSLDERVDSDIAAGRVRPVATQGNSSASPQISAPPQRTVIMSPVGQNPATGVAAWVAAAGVFVVGIVFFVAGLMFSPVAELNGGAPILIWFNSGGAAVLLVGFAICIPIMSNAGRNYPQLVGTTYRTKSLWGKGRSVDLAAAVEARFVPTTRKTVPAIEVRSSDGRSVRIYWLDLAANPKANAMQFGLIAASLAAGSYTPALGPAINVLRQWQSPPNVIFPELSPELSRKTVARHPELFDPKATAAPS